MPEILDFINSPRIVATVHRPEDLDFLAQNEIFDTCDLLEFRLDSLRNHLDHTEETITAAKVPCLVTARHPDEGGDGALDTVQRLALYERFLPHAALIDLEVRSLVELKSVVEIAKENRVAVIGSFHDFEKNPPLDTLIKVLNEAFAAGADVAKIAVRLDSMASLFEVGQFVDAFQHSKVVTPQPHLSLMGMGPLGKLSRLLFASAGSCLNYGYLVKANAPGQWSAAELKRLLAEVRPPQE